jgi:hypothetical protein
MTTKQRSIVLRVAIRQSFLQKGLTAGVFITMKSATLENGTEILVPQFVETGDSVHVDTEKVKYIERVMSRKI